MISIVQGGNVFNSACVIISYSIVEVKHVWQVYVTSELSAMVWTKIHKEAKWTKTSWNEVMQPTTTNNDSRPIFPYLPQPDRFWQSVY